MHSGNAKYQPPEKDIWCLKIPFLAILPTEIRSPQRVEEDIPKMKDALKSCMETYSLTTQAKINKYN